MVTKNTFTLLAILIYQVCYIQSLEIIFGGDVSFYGPIDRNFEMNNCPYNDVLKGLTSVFKTSDEVIVNLETTFGDSKELSKHKSEGKLVTFVSNPKTLESLKNAGITAVNLANNHLLDFGTAGAKSTITELKKEKMNFFGVTYGKEIYQFQEPLIIRKNGVKVCILSYCLNNKGCKRFRGDNLVGPPIFETDFIIKEVKHVKKKDAPNAVVIYVHMGREYEALNGKKTEFFVKLQKLSPHIDVMVMSHVHIVTPHFYYNNTLFTGHLGNLFFPTHMTKLGEIDEITDTNSSKLKMFMSEWARQMKYLKNESSRGKIVRLSFNRNGLVKKSSKYMYTDLKMDSDNCIRVYPSKNTWKMMCGKDDPNCQGTTKCNYISCQHQPNRDGEH